MRDTPMSRYQELATKLLTD
ncbi:hypothetical protein HU200_016121 [Digitaria exilis]|uniref:Uncharacterized protein n=1 Tax=Digitaria exilis TaxID=1010633 RepID=A0A835FA74_9POAL|nr:hypothetical protein HU200_016121 [Digitaria exilis]